MSNGSRPRFSRGEKLFGIGFVVWGVICAAVSAVGIVLMIWLLVTLIHYLQAHS